MVRLPLVFFGVTMGSKVGVSARKRHVFSRTPSEARTARMLLLGAITVSAGIGLVGTTQSDAGQVVLLGGWVLLGFAIHRFGRGPGGSARRPTQAVRPDT